jgi:hypothetical protein
MRIMLRSAIVEFVRLETASSALFTRAHPSIVSIPLILKPFVPSRLESFIVSFATLYPMLCIKFVINLLLKDKVSI